MRLAVINEQLCSPGPRTASSLAAALACHCLSTEGPPSVHQSRSYSAHFEKFPLSPWRLFVSGSRPPLRCSAVFEIVFLCSCQAWFQVEVRGLEEIRPLLGGECLLLEAQHLGVLGSWHQSSVLSGSCELGEGTRSGGTQPGVCRQDLMDARGG